MKNFLKFKHVHIIGICGVGMSGIAIFLKNKGYKITGSDIVKNETFHLLKKVGITIYNFHCKKNLYKKQLIIYSNAISKENEEIIYAKKLKIPIISRSKILKNIMNKYYKILISGTHGKTTVTGAIIHMLKQSKLNPNFINGGVLIDDYYSSGVGKEKYFVAELDESDCYFSKFDSNVSLITNIEKDHMEKYDYSLKKLCSYFLKFLNRTEKLNGYSIICLDDFICKKIIKHISYKFLTYGFNKYSDVKIVKYMQCFNFMKFYIFYKNKKIMKIKSNIIGKHNALNMTAVAAVGIKEGIKYKTIEKSLNTFKGVKRRLQFLGNYNFKYLNKIIKNIICIDDYAHHPKEIKCSIETLKLSWPNKKIILVFQPHRFSRLSYFYDKFINVLSKVDFLILLNVYSAGEENVYNFNIIDFYKSIKKLKKINIFFVKNKNYLSFCLFNNIKNNYLLLIQGAGTVSELMKKILLKYSHNLYI
ncbi:MAG: UDP-N-acetylmuramate--L-alanine ligase [Enterobacteriaceae bacterium]